MEDSSVPWTQRWQVWVCVLALAAAATVGGLALASRNAPAPPAPALHLGNLAKLPDGQFMDFLPTRADFPKSLTGFVTLTAEQLREQPEQALKTDPPQCDPTSPLRGSAILGEVRTDIVAASSSAYTFAVARESSGQNLVAALREQLDGCSEATLPPAVGGRETRQRKLLVQRLPDPDVGADRSISYAIKIVDASGDGDDDAVLYPPQTHILALAVVRGVALYSLARDTSLVFGADGREQLLSKLVRRIRMY
ncbi:hypothetical protein [Segniliparus rugosus]|uniref:hypothetical protein n=1 Tax=Segniliparus rugosus TaxID=286804 RepID=UPI00031CD936|nr:hypothetical protein [Segniliparus rugosus]